MLNNILRIVVCYIAIGSGISRKLCTVTIVIAVTPEGIYDCKMKVCAIIVVLAIAGATDYTEFGLVVDDCPFLTLTEDRCA